MPTQTDLPVGSGPIGGSIKPIGFSGGGTITYPNCLTCCTPPPTPCADCPNLYSTNLLLTVVEASSEWVNYIGKSIGMLVLFDVCRFILNPTARGWGSAGSLRAFVPHYGSDYAIEFDLCCPFMPATDYSPIHHCLGGPNQYDQYFVNESITSCSAPYLKFGIRNGFFCGLSNQTFVYVVTLP